MRYGLISDVHANLEALTAVLHQLEHAAVDRVVCLGDVVGYHANPNECLELLARAGALTIAGNHDRAAVGAIEPTDFGPAARKAIHWTRLTLLPEHAARLRQLDVFGWLDQSTCLVHAALHPLPNDRYHLSTKARVAASFAQLHSGRVPAHLCFFGHTHRAVVHRSDGRQITQVVPLGTGIVPLELGRYVYLINPGSVGQPRDRDQRASFAIFDDRRAVVEHRRVAYDVAACQRKAQAAGLLAPPRATLGKWLSRLVSHGGR
jgi:predicted phosphodiesterase